MYNKALQADYFNNLSKGYFPEMLGIKITKVEEGKMIAEMQVKKEYFAPNGFLHVGSIVTFADTVAGYSSFGTYLKKENHLPH